MKYILSLLFLILSMNVFSQGAFVDGFIVNLNNDTVPGQIKMTRFSNNCAAVKFKNEFGDVIKFKPYTIFAYKAGDKLFAAKQLMVREPLEIGVFMEVVQTGSYRLYRYWHSKSDLGFVKTFIQAPNEENTYFEVFKFGKSYKKRLAEYFKEHKLLSRRILAGYYTRKEINLIVEEYNRWYNNERIGK